MSEPVTRDSAGQYYDDSACVRVESDWLLLASTQDFAPHRLWLTTLPPTVSSHQERPYFAIPSLAGVVTLQVSAKSE